MISLDNVNPTDYIKKMKKRDPELAKGWGQIVTPLSLQTPGGKQRADRRVETYRCQGGSGICLADGHYHSRMEWFHHQTIQALQGAFLTILIQKECKNLLLFV